MLESYLKQRLEKNEILLMTHIVLGYPTFEDAFRIIEAMVNAGVDLMELQIPFSEPIADGPIILHANQKALAGGATVQKCMDFARKAVESSVPPGTEEINLRAFDMGYNYGKELVDKEKPKTKKKSVKTVEA